MTKQKPRAIKPDGTKKTSSKADREPRAPLAAKAPKANNVQSKPLKDHIADEPKFELTKARIGETTKTIISWSEGRLAPDPAAQNGLLKVKTSNVCGSEPSKKGPFGQTRNAENQDFYMKAGERSQVAPVSGACGTPGTQLRSQPSPATLLTRAYPGSVANTINSRIAVFDTDGHAKDEAGISKRQVPELRNNEVNKKGKGQDIISTVSRAQTQIRGAFQKAKKQTGSALGVSGQPVVAVRKKRGKKRAIRDSSIAQHSSVHTDSVGHADNVDQGVLSETALGELPAHQNSIATPGQARLPPGTITHVTMTDLASPALEQQLCHLIQGSAPPSQTPRMMMLLAPLAQELQAQIPHLKNIANCGNCGNAPELYIVCARCREMRYCGKYCQVWDWPLHRRVCVRCPSATDVEVDEQTRWLEDYWAGAMEMLEKSVVDPDLPVVAMGRAEASKEVPVRSGHELGGFEGAADLYWSRAMSLHLARGGKFEPDLFEKRV